VTWGWLVAWSMGGHGAVPLIQNRVLRDMSSKVVKVSTFTFQFQNENMNTGM
jgi:hypothetical protein